jgi:hypothetical protein
MPITSGPTLKHPAEMVKAIIRIAIYWGSVSLLLWTGRVPGSALSVGASIAYLLISPVMITVLACMACFARLHSQQVPPSMNWTVQLALHIGLEIVVVLVLVTSFNNLCQW